MADAALICLLWPKHHGLLAGFLGVRARVVYTLPGSDTETLRKLAATGGGRVELLPVDDVGDALREADACRRTRALRAHFAGQAPVPEPWASILLPNDLEASLVREMRLIDQLDAAAKGQPVEALLVSEEYMPLARLALQWARARGIPVLHVCHGANLARMYTVHQPAEADIFALVGERAGDFLADLGVEESRLVPVGSSQWEDYLGYEELRPLARRLLLGAHRLDADAHTLVFGTTWAAGLTAFADERVYDDTVAAFLAACQSLRRRGLRINCVIKDRPPNAAYAADRIAALAAPLGLTADDYVLTFNHSREWMLTADAVVAVESTLLIEAMLAGAPAVNLWHDASCVLGPAFAAGEGVLQAFPDNLADQLGHLLQDADWRMAVLDRARAVLPRFMVSGQAGESALRAGMVLDALAGTRAAAGAADSSLAQAADAPVWAELSRPADADLKGQYHDNPRKDLLALLERPPRRVLDVGCATGATGELIKTAWPEAHVTGVELNRAAASLAVGRVDQVINAPLEEINFAAHGLPPGSVDTLILADVLEHLYDPWGALVRLRPLLSEDAQLLVSLPNARNLWLLNELASGRFPYAAEGLLDITHIRWFTRAEMEKMLRETGFKPIRSARTPAAGLQHLTRPAGATTVETEKLSLKDVSDEEFEDLKALQIMYLAKPLRAGETAETEAGDEQDFYALWRLGHSFLKRDALWIAERMEALARQPVFHLAVLVPEGGEDRLANNIKALGHQFYNRWRLTVVSAEPAHPAVAEVTNIAWLQAPFEQHLITANGALSGADADWVGLWEAGDKLPPHALFSFADQADRHPEWRAMYSDEDRVDADDEHAGPFFKTDFNLEMLRAAPWAVGGLLLLERGLFTELGGFAPALDGAEAYDLVLRTWERVGHAGIGHVADVLYHRHVDGGHCRRAPAEAADAQRQALAAHLARAGLTASLDDGFLPGSLRVRYPVQGEPLVSILIPTRNQVDFLKRCITSLVEGTGYPHYEVLVLDNGSDDPEAVAYLADLKALGSSDLRVLAMPGPFNFSAMNNRAAEVARGDYLLLLNNDTAILEPDWLNEMLGLAQQPDVGAVGAKLHYPDGKIQHAGVILGMGDAPAEHPFLAAEPDADGYFGRAKLPQEFSAVTAACLLTRKAVYQEVGGLDEERFQVSYNDVDFCLRLRARGYRVVFTPYARLLHEGSVSQNTTVEDKQRQAKLARFAAEQDRFYDAWPRQIAFDSAYNRNFSTHGREFLIEISPALAWAPDWRPRPRVVAHPADRFGCGEYRIIAPMRALNEAGRVMGWETGNYLSVPELFRLEPEAIVFQRQVDPHQIELMERYIRHSQAFRVFEIDDLITNVPIKSIRKKLFVEQKDLHKRFRKAVSMCHRFVVSTDYLAEQYRGYTDEIVVVKNYIERARWGELAPRRRGTAKARVGWAGSVTHDGDLAQIFDVVKATAREVDWVFFGMCPDAIRPYVAEYHEGVKLDDYAKVLAGLDLDLAVAPLEDVPFNHGKSHLRILEYGVMGYPVICTDITPYRGNYPVTRVANRFKDWVEAIREHVADRDELARRGDVLREHINAEWILEDHLDAWLKAWLPT